jgi:ABC-type glycerol-3-phosphate transport system substrate-binding protein
MTASARIGATLAAALLGGLAVGSGATAKTLSVWHTEPNARSVAVIKEIIEAFEKANPGTKVEQEAIAWGDLDAKMQAALAAGAPPDIAHGQTYVERSLSAKGLLVPIDEVIKAIGEDDIYPVVRKLDHHSGHYWGLAHAIGTDLIIYRKDFYRAAGLDPDKAPATWAEWLAQLKKLTVDTNGDGKPDRYGLDLAGPGFFINEEVYMWAGSNGGRLFQDNGRPNLTSPPVLEMLGFWKQLHDCCLPPEWLSHGYLDTFANLATGKAASILGWGRGTDYFEKYAPDAVAKGDIGVFPTKPVGPSGQTFLTQLDCEPWMVFKDDDGAKEEIEFLKFFMRPDNYRRYIQTVPVHFFPITKSMQADPQYLATPDFQKWKFWVDAQQNVIANHDPKPLMITDWKDLDLPYIQEVAGSGILIDMVTDVVKNGRAPQDAAKRAQDRTEQLITQLGYKRW